MPQLDPTWFASQIFWLLITFGILYVTLSRAVLPGLRGVLERREQSLASDLELAERFRQQAQDAQRAYEHTLADARQRVQQLMDEATLASKARAEKAGREMDLQIAQKLIEAERQIGARKEQMLKRLYPTAAEVASLIIEKLTRHAPGHDQLQQVINELSKQEF